MTLETEIEVLDTIAHKNAIAFIGSGASCEMGYPSWGDLVRGALKKLVPNKTSDDYKSIEKAIGQNRYPEALGYLEKVTSRQKLCDAISELLTPSDTGTDSLYSILAKLPFACYLTTNYDDEMLGHLKEVGRTGFGVLRNSKRDFYSFRDDMKNIVFKIHGDLSVPHEAIITSQDYSKFSSAPEREYYRVRLQALFLMKRSVFVGYSLADRDLEIVLETLKQRCSEISPAFMFLPTDNKLDIEEYASRYGVRIIPYKAKGNDHSMLVRKLESYYKFLSKTDDQISRVSDDSLHAAELYLFRVLNKNTQCLDLSNYILMHIPNIDGRPISAKDLASRSNVQSEVHLNRSLAELIEIGYIEEKDNGYIKTKYGEARANEALSSLSAEKDMAFDDFLSRFTIPPDAVDKCFNMLQSCLSRIFALRGDALVKAIFNRAADISGGAKIDIYSVILPYAAQLGEETQKTEFLHAVYDFIVRPTPHQKTYLVAMAQGYFLYHMMSHGSEEANLIKEKLNCTVWYVDSNLLIPLVAVGCANHKYAVELFTKLKSLGVRIVVVPSVLEEVRRHLKWAKEHNPRDKENYASVVQGYSTQQNLFVDGYIRMTVDGKVKSFEQYLGHVNSLLARNAHRLLELYGMQYETPWKIYDWDKAKYSELKLLLEQRRKKTASFRRNFQVETDAELLYAMQCRRCKNEMCADNEEVCFLSQSTLFEEESNIIRTWSGEAMFRLVQMIMPVMSSEETLHECLQNELYHAGIQFIDENKYGEFFEEEIDWAEMTFEQQKKEFCRVLNEPDESDMSRRFASLTELQKPIFIRQMQEKIKITAEHKVQQLKEQLRDLAIQSSDDHNVIKSLKDEIAVLRAEKKRNEATIRDSQNRIENLESGKAYKKMLRRSKSKKRHK